MNLSLLVPETTDITDHIADLWQCVVRQDAQVVVETGTARGDSARIWAAALTLTGGKLWSIDKDSLIGAWGDTFKRQYPQHTFLTGDSATIPWDLPIDILFLDSDHHYDHVLAELRHFAPWMRKGSTIFVHDSDHEAGDAPGLYFSLGGNVVEAVQRFTRPHRLRWIHHPGQWGMIEIPITKALT